MMNQHFLKIRVHADAKQDEIKIRGKDAYDIWVRAPAQEGQANVSVLTLLARQPELSGRSLRIVKGAHSASKIVSVI